MVCLVVNNAVMPQQTEVAVVELHFLDEAFDHEVRFLLIEVHVVLVAQRTIHDE